MHLLTVGEYAEQFCGQVKVRELFSTKYLGEIICSEGSNTKNVTDGRNRGFGKAKKSRKCWIQCVEAS